MKSYSWLITILISAFVLSGCYTQLQFSQGIHRITDDYSRYDDNRDRNRDPQTDDYAEAEVYDSETIPYYYLDYKTAAWYDRQSFGGSYWGSASPYYGGYHYNPYYDSYFAFSFGIHSFHHPHHFGFWSWHHPFHHHYHHFTWGGFHHPFAFTSIHNTQFFFVSSSPVIIERDNRRFSRRSIGANRVRSSGKTAVRKRNGVTRSRVGLTRRSSGNRKSEKIGERRRTGRSSTVRSRSGNRQVRSRNRKGTVRKTNRSGRTDRRKRVDKNDGNNRSGNDIIRRRSINRSRDYSRTSKENLKKAKIDYDQQRRRLRDFKSFRNRFRISFPAFNRMKIFSPSKGSNTKVRSKNRIKKRSKSSSSVKRKRSGSVKRNSRSSDNKKKRSSGKKRGGN